MIRALPVITTDFYQGDGVLICPTCKFEYLHHGKVIVYDREEDELKITRVEIDGSDVQVNHIDNGGSGNPSSRRHGIAIQFWCEGCDIINELTFAQHKGVTMVEWRNNIVDITNSPRFRGKI